MRRYSKEVRGAHAAIHYLTSKFPNKYQLHIRQEWEGMVYEENVLELSTGKFLLEKWITVSYMNYKLVHFYDSLEHKNQEPIRTETKSLWSRIKSRFMS